MAPELEPPRIEQWIELRKYFRPVMVWLSEMGKRARLLWSDIDFTGSKISDILDRQHSALQDINAAGAHTAAAISNTPAGNIAATDVQAAINELDTEKVPMSYLDPDGTLAANSDLKIATQKAVKTYCDQIIAAANAMVYKGLIDCSGNPNYPAADAGWLYRISVAGKIGGAAGINVEVGDILLCIADGTPSGTQAAVGAFWGAIQANIDGAVVGPASSANNNFPAFDGTTGKIIKDSGYGPSSFTMQAVVNNGATVDKSVTFTDATKGPILTSSDGKQCMLTIVKDVVAPYAQRLIITELP